MRSQEAAWVLSSLGPIPIGLVPKEWRCLEAGNKINLLSDTWRGGGSSVGFPDPRPSALSRFSSGASSHPEVCMGPAPSPGFRGWHVSQLGHQMPPLGDSQQLRKEASTLHKWELPVDGTSGDHSCSPLEDSQQKERASGGVERVCCPDITKPLDL